MLHPEKDPKKQLIYYQVSHLVALCVFICLICWNLMIDGNRNIQPLLSGFEDQDSSYYRRFQGISIY